MFLEINKLDNHPFFNNLGGYYKIIPPFINTFEKSYEKGV